MGCNGMPFFSSNFLLQTEEDEHPHPHPHHQHQLHQPPTSLSPLLPSFSPQNFHGIASLLGKTAMSFSGIHHICDDVMNGEEDLSDDGLSHGGKKKRRLNIEQVRTLEKTFEQRNKLEPERKMQLARDLGLKPRQIAIWFQNRKARCKTKQLEKDYGILKKHFDAVKAENDSLVAQNQKLHAQIVSLRSCGDHLESINLNKETIIDQGSCSTRSDNSSDIQLDISRTPTIDSSPHVPISIHLFPASSSHHNTSTATNTAAELFLTTPPSRPDHHHHHQLMSHSTLRPEHHHNPNKNSNHNQHVKEESFTNMFCGMEYQTGSLWPWLEQQQFN